MQQTIICKGCWSQRHMPIPIRGPFSIPFKLFGLRPSRMNPNVCTICETKFTKVMKRKQIIVPATILFADIRGYTSFSELMDSPQLACLLSAFYENCASVAWERDGILNKLMGDAILAIFNFPITRSDHIKQAVLTGIDLQRRCLEMKARIGGPEGEKISVGVGIHTGDVPIGEVGEFCRDFTAIGEVVNIASRLQGVANLGEVIITEDVYRHVEDISPQAEPRVYNLKGIAKPVDAYVIHAF